MRKSTASFFESQKTANSNMNIVKMFQKCFVQTKKNIFIDGNFLLCKKILPFTCIIGQCEHFLAIFVKKIIVGAFIVRKEPIDCC